MAVPGSDSLFESWLLRLASGDVAAAERLWQHFFSRLQEYAKVALSRLPPHAGDELDISASVFKSLCRMIERRVFPKVSDPEELWPLIAVIAARKVARVARRSRVGKPGRILREGDLVHRAVGADELVVLSQALSREPSPELTAAMIDSWATLASRLDLTERKIADLLRDGASIEEMSTETGVALRTVARKLAKIRRLARELLGREPDDLDDS